jgi:hypothetical protein
MKYFKFNRTKWNIMDNEEPPRPSGIDINIKAPLINTIDIYENQINLNEILNDFNGVLLDFFRGNW